MTMAPLIRLTAALAALSGATLLAGTPFGTSDTALADVSRVYVESGFVQPESTIDIDVIVEATAPGVGAWNVDLTYDDSLVSITAVAATDGRLCSPEFGANTARMVGYSESGLTGAFVLCTFTFTAGDDEGVADLAVTVNQLTDPSGGDLGASPEDGTITITQVTPTPVPTPSPSPTPLVTPSATASPTPLVTPAPVLPSTGGPGMDGGKSTALAIATIGAILAAAGAWILRSRLLSP